MACVESFRTFHPFVPSQRRLPRDDSAAFLVFLGLSVGSDNPVRDQMFSERHRLAFAGHQGDALVFGVKHPVFPGRHGRALARKSETSLFLVVHNQNAIRTVIHNATSPVADLLLVGLQRVIRRPGPPEGVEGDTCDLIPIRKISIGSSTTSQPCLIPNRIAIIPMLISSE